MKRASQLQDLRDEQRDEMMKKTAAERIAIALELSDACVELSKAAKKAIEVERAVTKA